MTHIRRKKNGFLAAIACLMALFLGVPAGAEEFGDPTPCLVSAIADNEPVSSCISDAQTKCLAHEAPSMAGANCFRRAKEFWGGLIKERMEQIQAKASEQLAAIAGIEVKYDLKSNLMQCDRMEELTLVRKDPDEETLYSRQRCEASAVGLAYAKLYFQSSRID